MTSHDFWPGIIEKVKQELALYKEKKIRPTLRAMFYRLLSKNILPNTGSAYSSLSAYTARARENRTLPINCFRDDSPIIDVDDEYLTPEQIIDDH